MENSINNDVPDKVIKELFDSFEIDGKIVFDHVQLFYYKCHKINPNGGGSYIDSPDWIENKKATINAINKKDNKWFQYAVSVVLNHEEIGKHVERMKALKFPSVKDCRKKNEKNIK